MRRSTRALSFAGLTLAIVAACNRTPRTDQSSSGATPTPAATSGDKAITLERMFCYGTCPVYKVTMRSDGTVLFDGARNVAVTGTRTWRVPAESAATVFRFADSVQFVGLPAKYDFGEPGCGSYIADHPAFALTLETGATKRVYVDEGCRNVPTALPALRDLVDRVARVEASVGKP